MLADSDAVAAGDHRLLRYLLPVSVFLSGAVVMVLEVLGTRLIAPVYGTSLHVWSAIIAVTLLSLSVGYWLGGRVADRFPRASVYFLLFEAAALLILLLPLIREPVLSLTKPLGLRSGALTSAILFLGVPLTLLGMISPFAVRLAAHVIADLGRTAGRLYALSTAGSLIGTLAAGFYLIPSFRLRTIFVGSALVLALPAAIYQLLGNRRQLVATALVLAATGAALLQPVRTVADIREVVESHFGQIKVLDERGSRTLMVNGTIQTQTIAGSNVVLSAYPPVMAELAWRVKPSGRRALLIGLGGGVMPVLFDSFGVETHAVEIDPEVVRIAREYFLFDSRRHPVTIGDGRQFLDSTPTKFDYVLLDAFGGEAVPIHLLTAEMMALIDDHLAPHGIVVINFVGFRTDEEGRPLRSVVRTMATRFEHVTVFPSYPPGDYGNNIIIAAHDPISLHGGARPFMVAPWMEEQVVLQPPIAVEGSAVVLTDDYNPLDLWGAESSEKWRAGMMASLSNEVMFAE